MSTVNPSAELGTATLSVPPGASPYSGGFPTILPSPSESWRRPDENGMTGNATEHTQKRVEGIGPLIRLTGGALASRQFKVLQQWEGVVSEVDSNHIAADILDLTDPSKPLEIVQIAREEIPEADHDLLQLGCVFYWTIGYQITDGGQKSRVSEIRLRRNPKWSQHAIDSIKAKGKKLYEQFTDHSKDDAACPE